MRRCVLNGFAAVILLSSATVLLGQGGPVRYVYDEAGRLVGVIDASGNAAAYHYDAVGNLLSITRSTSSQVSIIEFTPHTGPIGQTVSIFGTGFSSTPSLNTVTVNGTTATVTSASTTVLVITVPSGATSGTIAVTSPNGSDSSADAFSVTTSTAPTISGFTPSAAVAGTSVTVTGTNFQTVAAANTTRYNSSFTTPSAATATSVTATVPASTGSGRITIKTPSGTAVSTDDLIVPPPPYGTSDVASAARIPLATATTVTLSTANTIALRLFDGAPGDRISLLGTNGMTGQILGCDVPVTVLGPFGTALAPATCMEGTGFLDTKTLPVSGTYSIVVDPAGAATGSVTLTRYEVPADFSTTITAGGSAVTATMSTPGQNGSVTFSGTTSQRVSLVGTNGISGQIALVCDVNTSLVTPSGAVLAGPACMESSGFLDVTTLTATGTHTIVVDPTNHATGSLTLTLHDVPADFTSSITPGGSAVTASMGTPGQNGALTFTGTAGQRISLRGTNGLTGQILGCDVTVSIRNPDDSVLAPATCMEGSGFIDVQTLPTNGTYRILVDPVNHAVGSVTLALHDVPADTTGTVTVGGSAVGVSLGTPGQNGTLTFSGTASQQVTVRMTSNTFGSVTVKLLKPDGSQLTSTTSTLSSFNLATQTLPTTGTYTIVVDPTAANTGAVTVSVTNP